MLTFIKKLFFNWYMHYELITCIYMFEPWERKLINGIALTILCLVSFSSYMYLPKYIETFVHFLSPSASPVIIDAVHGHSPIKIPIN